MLHKLKNCSQLYNASRDIGMSTTNIGPASSSEDFKAQQRQMWDNAAT